MNKVFLRKIYPYIDNGRKDIKWRRITDSELDRMTNQTQKIANCYLDSTRAVLCASEQGREILKKRIFVQTGNLDDPAYKFVFNVNGKDKPFRVDRNDYYSRPYYKIYDRYIEELLTGKLADIFNGMPNIAMDIAVCKMVTKYPKEKEWFLRVYRQPIYENLKCENNRPTKAFEWLTGRKPKFIIAEDGFKDKLSNHKEESIALLQKLSQLSPKNYSFIAMTGNQKAATIPKWHCMPVMFVKDGVELKDKRTDQGYKFTYENFIDRFKSLVGIIWNDSK